MDEAALFDAAGPGPAVAYHITYYLAGPAAVESLPGGEIYRKLSPKNAVTWPPGLRTSSASPRPKRPPSPPN